MARCGELKGSVVGAGMQIAGRHLRQSRSRVAVSQDPSRGSGSLSRGGVASMLQSYRSRSETLQSRCGRAADRNAIIDGIDLRGI